MAISEKVFPEGDLQNIIATSPTQKDYNIRATKDLVDQLPGGIIKDVLAPATAGVMSIPYDAIQATQRMKPGSGVSGFIDAYKAENPLSSAYERMVGASGPLFDRFSNIEGQTAFLDPVSVIVGAGKVAKGAGILDVMKNIFVNKVRQKATSKAVQAAKDALAAKKRKKQQRQQQEQRKKEEKDMGQLITEEVVMVNNLMILEEDLVLVQQLVVP